MIEMAGSISLSCHGIRATLDSATEQHWAKSLKLSFPMDGMRLITSCPVTGGF